MSSEMIPESASWEGIWMAGSLIAGLIGYLGWQLMVVLAGGKSIAKDDPNAPKFSVIRSIALAPWLSNREFKKKAVTDADGTTAGRWFFYLFIAGIVSLIASFAYVAMLAK